MKYTVRERLNRHFVIEFLFIIIFLLLGLNRLFDFNQHLYSIVNIFNIELAMKIKNIMDFFPAINWSLVIYIISININFNNVNYLTKEYIKDYIKKTKVIYIVLSFLIILYSLLLVNLYRMIFLAFYILVVFYFLKILYTKIYFKIKSKKFITKEEYEKECAEIETKNKIEAKTDNGENETEIKKTNRGKPITIFFTIYFILWTINFLILFLVPSCGLFSTCSPDGLAIFLTIAMILIPIGILAFIVIITASIFGKYK